MYYKTSLKGSRSLLLLYSIFFLSSYFFISCSTKVKEPSAPATPAAISEVAFKKKPKSSKRKRLKSTRLDGTSLCKTCSAKSNGKDYSGGKTFVNKNFAAMGTNALVGADFSNDTLIACRFDGMNLSNVNFSGAVLKSDSATGNPTSLANTILTNTCFINSTLGGVDFQFATYENTDFTCAEIWNTEFGLFMTFKGDTATRTDFTEADISMASAEYLFPLNNLGSGDWAKTNFSYTNFNGLSTGNFTPAGKDMSYAILKGINLTRFNLSACNLTAADLTDADLSYAYLDTATCYGINFSNASLKGLSARKTDFFDSRYNPSNFYHAVLVNANLDQSDLQQAKFTGANMSEASIQAANMQKCDMEGDANSSAATLVNVNFNGTDLSSAYLNSVTFSKAFLKQTVFEHLTVSGTKFIDCILSGASFYNSELQETSFNFSTLHNVNFSSCEFTSSENGSGTDFSCTLLGGSDFTSSTLNKGNFTAAVIPPDSLCCPQKDTTDAYMCGYDTWTKQPYGATILPDLQKVAVTCPNEDVAVCTGTQWNIPNWKSASCSENREMETLWTAPDCSGGGTDTAIVISDPNLQQCIANQLFGEGKSGIITKELAATVTSLECVAMDIRDISGLDRSNFPNLESINLEANQITDDIFYKLSSLLNSIKVSNNELSTLTVGQDQYNVTYIDASHNNIGSVGLTNAYLNYLDLSHNELEGTLKIFSGYNMSGLTVLDLSFNQLKDIGYLNGLSKLTSLYLQNNDLTTIGDMGKLWECAQTDFSLINLENNNCFDCSSLDPNSNCSPANSIITASFCKCDPTDNCANCDEDLN